LNVKHSESQLSSDVTGHRRVIRKHQKDCFVLLRRTRNDGHQTEVGHCEEGSDEAIFNTYDALLPQAP